jgi:hypothetical protein
LTVSIRIIGAAGKNLTPPWGREGIPENSLTASGQNIIATGKDLTPSGGIIGRKRIWGMAPFWENRL